MAVTTLAHRTGKGLKAKAVVIPTPDTFTPALEAELVTTPDRTNREAGPTLVLNPIFNPNGLGELETQGSVEVEGLAAEAQPQLGEQGEAESEPRELVRRPEYAVI